MRYRKTKLKLYGGKVDVGGKVSRGISRLTKSIVLATLIALYNIIASFASVQPTEELNPTAVAPETVMIEVEEIPEQVTVPVTRIEPPEPEYAPDNPEDDPNVLSEDEKGTYLGEFCITHYCTCSKCNGSNAGKTAIGYVPIPWNTVAVDPNLIPLGSTLYIEGYGIVNAIDTGSAVNGYHIDMMVEDHETAIQQGVVYREVYLL